MATPNPAASPLPMTTPPGHDHGPLSITFINPQLTYKPGDTIKGYVAAALARGELIEAIEVSLIGTAETEISPQKRPVHGSPNRTSVRTHNRLIDMKKSIPLMPTNISHGIWPFEFTVPELTDSVGRFGSSLTSRKFAIQRHQVPPTFFHKDAHGNMARVEYGILAHMSRSSRNLEPYEQWETLRIDIRKPQQDNPPANRHDLKPVVTRIHRPIHAQTPCGRLKDFLSCRANCSHLRLSPTIFIPDDIIPGRPLPFTILLTPKPKSSADPSNPQIELINLCVVLREETSILGSNDRFHRIRAWFGHSITLAEKQITLEEQRIETSAPTIFEKEGTQSLLKRLLAVEDGIQPNVKTFNISKCHRIAIKADLVAEKEKFSLDLSLPVTVLQGRQMDTHSDAVHTHISTTATTPGGDHFAATCPICRHRAAARVARQLLDPVRIPNVYEYSRESTMTNSIAPSRGPYSRPTTMFGLHRHLEVPEELWTIRDEVDNRRRSAQSL